MPVSDAFCDVAYFRSGFEDCIDISGDSLLIVGERHGCPANDEELGLQTTGL